MCQGFTPPLPEEGCVLGPSLRMKDAFRLLCEPWPIPMRIDASDGHILEANPAACRLHRLPREALIGRSIFDGLSPSRAAQLKRAYAVLLEGETRPFDTATFAANGWEIPVRLTGVRIQHGNDPALLVQLEELQDSPQTQAESLRCNREREEPLRREEANVLSPRVIDEMSNLFASVLGSLDLTIRDLPSAAPCRTYVEAAHRGAHQAALLWRLILMCAGPSDEPRDLVDLNANVRTLGPLLKASLPQGSHLRLDLAAELPPFQARSLQLRQIIVHLVLAAADSLQATNGIVVVRSGATDCSPEEAWLPAPPGRQAKWYVFLEVSLMTLGGGAPLEIRAPRRPGVAFSDHGFRWRTIAKLTKAQGGTIQKVDASTVRLLFPIGSADRRSVLVPESAPRPSASPPAVLLVDDEETLRTLGRDMLQRLGYEVLVAADGEQAVRVCEKHRDRIVCVLLDLTMPGMDGTEALRRIRQIHPAVRVVVSSGHEPTQIMERLAGCPADGILTKPYTMANLERELRTLCCSTL